MRTAIHVALGHGICHAAASIPLDAAGVTVTVTGAVADAAPFLTDAVPLNVSGPFCAETTNAESAAPSTTPTAALLITSVPWAALADSS